jgi:hypothetical protein
MADEPLSFSKRHVGTTGEIVDAWAVRRHQDGAVTVIAYVESEALASALLALLNFCKNAGDD